MQIWTLVFDQDDAEAIRSYRSENEAKQGLIDWVVKSIEDNDPEFNRSAFMDGPNPLDEYLRDKSVPLEQRFHESVAWLNEDGYSVYVLSSPLIEE